MNLLSFPVNICKPYANSRLSLLIQYLSLIFPNYSPPFRCHASLSLTFCPAVVAVSFFGLHNFPSDNPKRKTCQTRLLPSVVARYWHKWLWQHQPQWQRQRPGITTIVRQQQQQEAIANFCKHKKAFFFFSATSSSSFCLREQELVTV